MPKGLNRTQYRYPETMPASIGFGPCLAVEEVETRRRIGFVRRILGGGAGHRWMVYDLTGSEVGAAPTRGAAASRLSSPSVQR